MNCHRISRTLALATVGAMVAVPLAAQDTAEETRSWLHVQVEGQGDEGERMALNLPLRAIGAVTRTKYPTTASTTAASPDTSLGGAQRLAGPAAPLSL